MAIGLYGPEYLQFDEGGPAAEVEIFVFERGTKVKAQLFADRTGLYTGPNPVWTDRRGELVFFVEEGQYDLHYPESNTTVPIVVEPTEEPGEGGGGGPGGHEHLVTAPALLHQIVHTLNFKPAGVVNIDSLGVQMEQDRISYPADNIVEVIFLAPFGPGKIYLS